MTVDAASNAWGLTAGLEHVAGLLGAPWWSCWAYICTYAIAMLIGGLVLVPLPIWHGPWDVAGPFVSLSLASTLLAYLLLGAGLTRISSTRAW